MKNYVELGRRFFGGKIQFAYLDLRENLAAAVLRKHQVRMKFVNALQRPDTEYFLVMILVPRKDEKKFHAAMEDLKTKMLVCGHSDYESRGGELIAELEMNIRMEKEISGRVRLPAGKVIRAGKTA